MIVPVTLWGYVAAIGFGEDWGTHVAGVGREGREDVEFAEIRARRKKGVRKETMFGDWK